ncbi:MAG: hypothetical protein WCG96_08300 [Actinomycetes bacterium]
MIGLVVVFGGITTPNESLPCEQFGCASSPAIAGLDLSEHEAGAARVAVSVIDPPEFGTSVFEGTKLEMVGATAGFTVTVEVALTFPATLEAFRLNV